MALGSHHVISDLSDYAKTRSAVVRHYGGVGGRREWSVVTSVKPQIYLHYVPHYIKQTLY